MAWLSECYKYNFDFDGKKIGFVHVVNEEKAMLTVDGGYCNVMFKSIEAIENFKVDPRILKLEQKDGGQVLKLDSRPIYCFTHIEDALKCCERVVVFDDGHKTVIRKLNSDGWNKDIAIGRYDTHTVDSIRTQQCLELVNKALGIALEEKG